MKNLEKVSIKSEVYQAYLKGLNAQPRPKVPKYDTKWKRRFNIDISSPDFGRAC